MKDRIHDALRGWDVDYVEIRVEESATDRIQYRGRDLEDIGKSSSLGGAVRALHRGGWGFVSFNSLDDLRSRVRAAVEQAKLVGRETSTLADIPAVETEITARIVKDPSSVSLSSKKLLLDEYNEQIWGVAGIQTSAIRYSDTKRTTTFASTSGSYIVQHKHDCSANIGAIARDGAIVQQAHLSLGSLGDFSFIENLHDKVKECAETAVRLVSARAAKGGQYTVILDPVLAGVFIHEAFGHLSESDFVYENDRMREIMVLGKRFAPPHLNVVDGAAVEGLRGSFAYDDEGAPSKKTYLIREGILTGRLHSRETAGKMAEAPTGNARAISYRYPPIVRMTNTYIEPGNASFEEMLGDVKEGIYAKSWYGGTTTMEQFTFSAAEAFMIRDGKIAEPLRGVVLTGNLFTTLENIDAIGNDLHMSQGGGCGKGGQVPLPVSDGGPHIRIQNCTIGGE